MKVVQRLGRQPISALAAGPTADLEWLLQSGQGDQTPIAAVLSTPTQVLVVSGLGS
jgi:hypothetical protein